MQIKILQSTGTYIFWHTWEWKNKIYIKHENKYQNLNYIKQNKNEKKIIQHP